MNKIPAAEEYLKDNYDPYYDEDNDPIYHVWQIKRVMIEFAKLHVKKAIEMCIEEAPSGSSTDTVSYKDVVDALTDCYPLDNIK